MPGARESRRAYKRPEDPVHEYDGKWWFWLHTGSQRIGPYDTRPAAERAMDRVVQADARRAKKRRERADFSVQPKSYSAD